MMLPCPGAIMPEPSANLAATVRLIRDHGAPPLHPETSAALSRLAAAAHEAARRWPYLMVERGNA